MVIVFLNMKLLVTGTAYKIEIPYTYLVGSAFFRINLVQSLLTNPFWRKQKLMDFGLNSGPPRLSSVAFWEKERVNIA